MEFKKAAPARTQQDGETKKKQGNKFLLLLLWSDLLDRDATVSATVVTNKLHKKTTNPPSSTVPFTSWNSASIDRLRDPCVCLFGYRLYIYTQRGC